MAVKELTAADFDAVIASDKLTVVDFWATWCGPCMMLGPVMEEVSAEMPDVDFYKVNTDENVSLAMQLGIDAIPCVFFFRNGKAVGQSLGFVHKDVMMKRIEAVLE